MASAAAYLEGDYEQPTSIAAKIAGGAANVLSDPLTLAPAGGVLRAVAPASKLGKLAQAGSTLGKIVGATNAERGAQALRRLATGSALAGSEMGPVGVLGSVPLQMVGEKYLAKLAKGRAAENLLEKTPLISKAAKPASKVAKVAEEAIDGPTPTASPAAMAGENLGRTVRLEAGGRVDADDIAMHTQARKNLTEAILPQPTPENTTAGVAKLKGLIGEKPATPPVRGPLIGEDEPDFGALETLKQTVARSQAAKSTGVSKSTKAKVPKVGTVKVAPKGVAPLAPEPFGPPIPSRPLPPQATQLQMDLPTSGPVNASVAPKMAQQITPNPPMPPWLKTAPQPFEEILGTPQQLGRATSPEIAALQSNPAVMQVLNDPTLTEDKKLEMILRGLGAIT